MLKISKITLLFMMALIGISLVSAINETNLTCEDDFYSDLYCSNENAYKDFHSFSDECIENISSELVEECEFVCENGICIEKPEPVCDSDNLNLCVTEEVCSGASGYWYDNSCNAEPEPPKVLPDDCVGCVLNDKCYPFNYRKADLYCSIETNDWGTQKPLGELCDDNFECKSNRCVEEKCMEMDWLTKIWNWIMNLFKWGK